MANSWSAKSAILLLRIKDKELRMFTNQEVRETKIPALLCSLRNLERYLLPRVKKWTSAPSERITKQARKRYRAYSNDIKDPK